MKLGITLGHDGESVRTTARYAAQAEACGLDIVGVPDSQSVFREAYCAATAVALATSRIQVGPLTTNPLTRHALVTASSVATLDELSGGRAFLGIGRGDSALANAGLKAPPASVLADAVDQIREAVDAAVDGTAVGTARLASLTWPKRQFPLIVSCSTAGRRAQRVAAHHGDGAILIGDVGDSALVGDLIARLRESRQSGPRADTPLSIWVYAPGYLEPTEHGRDTVAGLVSSVARNVLSPDEPDHRIPDEHRPALRSFRERYSFASHASAVQRENADLARELGLEDFFFDRLAIGGSLDDLTNRIQEYDDLGVDALVFSGSVADKSSFITALGTVAMALNGTTQDTKDHGRR